jgi:L-asparagine oxygenase
LARSDAASAPSAGRGRGTAVNTEALELELDARTSEVLGAEMEKRALSPYDDTERAILEAARVFYSRMDAKVLASIERFVMDPGSLSILRLSNLPLDSVLPPTPADGQSIEAKLTYATEGVLLGIGRTLGHPYAFKKEKKGKIIQQVCPVPKSAHQLSNEGSLADLGMHVENSFSEFRPHYLVLFCLRGDRDHAAKTRLASGKAIASRLSPEHLAAARAPEFLIQAPTSFAVREGEKLYSEPTPMLFGPEEYPELRLDLAPFTEFLTKRAEEAFAAIQEAIAEPGVVLDVDLQPGQALLLANRKVSHGRTVFNPRYDGQDRWLQRMFTISDPWQMRANVDERLRVV